MGTDREDNSSPQVLDAKTIITRVDKIHFEGLDRTKQDILKELVKPIFNTGDFADVLHNVKLVRQRFFELGLFRDVQVSIDDSKKGNQLNDNLSNIAITFDVEETRRYAGGVFTSASNNDASLTLELRSPNLLGRGEELRGQFEYSWKYFSSWSASLSKPLIKPFWPSLYSKLDFNIIQSAKDAPWSSYKELDRAFFCDLNIQPTLNQTHMFRLENNWRYLFSPTETPFPIREQFGHSLKTSLSHTYAYDLRDNPILPTEGFLFKLYNEYAGLTKNGVSFLKHELELQQSFSIYDLLSFQATFKCGFLKAFQNVTISDNFFLGGPLNLRGFEMNRVGPHVSNSAVGGNAFWIGGLHAYVPLPFKNSFNDFLRVHCFLNAGTLSDVNSFKNILTGNKLLNDIRLSYGLGLVMLFGNKARLEINYCLPFKSQSTDRTTKGLQFGIGLNYT